jgi:hypothetical protein
MKKSIVVLSFILAFTVVFFGALYGHVERTRAAPQTNDLSEEQLWNKVYNATDGTIQMDLVNPSRAMTPQDNKLSVVQILNKIYNATDGTFQTSCDNCGGGTSNDFAEYVNITGVAPPYMQLKNTTAEDTDAGRESLLYWTGVQSGGEVSRLVELRGEHAGASDDEQGRLLIKVNDGNDGTTLGTVGTFNSTGFGLFKTPTEPLDVSGQSLFTTDSTFSSGYITQFADPDGGNFLFKNASNAAGTFLPMILASNFGTGNPGAGFYIQSEYPVANDVYNANFAAVTIDGARSGGADLQNTNILNIRNNGTSKMLMRASGRVGTSVTTPGRFLDVLDASNPQIRWTHTVGVNYGEVQADSNGDTTITTSGDEVTISEILYKIGTFAEIYVHDNTTAQSIPTGTTYTKLTAWDTNGSSSNATADATNDKITITKTGYYEVTHSAGADSGTTGVVFDYSIFLNAVEQQQCEVTRKYATATDVGAHPISCFIDVTTVPWDVDLRARHDNVGSINLTIQDGNLHVKYIGET